ncbi:MAG TPA: hypothetical protein V6D20_18035, partial [Candidatus Obscuribacterales bacterium]
YWRVAGGSNAGALGRFSEPEKLDLDHIRSLRKSEAIQITPSVMVEKPKPVAKPPAPKVTAKAVPETGTLEVEKPLVGPPPPPKTYFQVTGHLRATSPQVSLEADGADGTRANLNGSQPLALQARGLYHFNSKFAAGFALESRSYQWTEKDLGDSLTWSELTTALLFHYGSWEGSLDYVSAATIERAEAQRLHAVPVSLVGITLGHRVELWNTLHGKLFGGYAVGGSQSQLHLGTEWSVQWRWSEGLALETGVGFNWKSLSGDSGASSSQLQSEFLVFLGLPFGFSKQKALP